MLVQALQDWNACRVQLLVVMWACLALFRSCVGGPMFWECSSVVLRTSTAARLVPVTPKVLSMRKGASTTSVQLVAASVDLCCMVRQLQGR